MEIFTAFNIRKREKRSRLELLEGTVDVERRTYYDPLFFYIRVSPGFIKLDTSRDFDGERLILHFIEVLGPSRESPRIEVGGPMDEERSAFLCVDWVFPPEELPRWKEMLNQCLKQEIWP